MREKQKISQISNRSGGGESISKKWDAWYPLSASGEAELGIMSSVMLWFIHTSEKMTSMG